ERITVMDRKGRPYLDPTNPALGKLTLKRAREQEVEAQVADQLNWIKGVRIWAKVDDRGDATPAAAAVQGQPGVAGREAAAPAQPSPSIAVNQPADLGESAVPRPPDPPAVEEIEHGRVLVYVPRSYYYSRMLPHPEHREPTVEELREVAARTKDQVE